MCCWEGSGCRVGSAGYPGLGPAFDCLPLLAAPSLFPFKLALTVPSLCAGCRRETLPFPVSLVQSLVWGGWEVPFRVSAHHHLDRTEKRKRRQHGKTNFSPASSLRIGSPYLSKYTHIPQMCPAQLGALL